MVKRWMFSVCLALCLVAGCGVGPKERIDSYNAALQQTKDVSAQIDTQAEALQVALDQANVLLADTELPAEQKATVLETAAKLQANLTEVKGYKQKADEKIAKLTDLVARAAAGGQISDELKLYGDGIGAAAPYLGKFGAYAILAQLILNVISTMFAAKKQKEAKENAEAKDVAVAKYQAHKVGVESTLKDIAASQTVIPAIVASKMYDNIGKARAASGIV